MQILKPIKRFQEVDIPSTFELSKRLPGTESHNYSTDSDNFTEIPVNDGSNKVELLSIYANKPEIFK